MKIKNVWFVPLKEEIGCLEDVIKRDKRLLGISLLDVVNAVILDIVEDDRIHCDELYQIAYDNFYAAKEGTHLFTEDGVAEYIKELLSFVWHAIQPLKEEIGCLRYNDYLLSLKQPKMTCVYYLPDHSLCIEFYDED